MLIYQRVFHFNKEDDSKPTYVLLRKQYSCREVCSEVDDFGRHPLQWISRSPPINAGKHTNLVQAFAEVWGHNTYTGRLMAILLFKTPKAVSQLFGCHRFCFRQNLDPGSCSRLRRSAAMENVGIKKHARWAVPDGTLTYLAKGHFEFVDHVKITFNYHLVMTNSLPWKDPPCY